MLEPCCIYSVVFLRDHTRVKVNRSSGVSLEHNNCATVSAQKRGSVPSGARLARDLKRTWTAWCDHAPPTHSDIETFGQLEYFE